MPGFDVVVIGGGPAGAATAITCSKLGLDVLIVEQGTRNRHKPCGGILPPVCNEVIQDIAGEDIPPWVMSRPNRLGLHYVPPSGRANGGKMRGYTLLNVDRDRFDRWLRGLAEENVEIRYGTTFLRFEKADFIRVILADGGITTARYLIGADGVYSKVRKQMYGVEERVSYVVHDYCRGEGDFEDCFYAFFKEEISPIYGYLIPKDDLYTIGVAIPKADPELASARLDRFKEWLAEEFAFRQEAMVGRDAWAIPRGFIRTGIGNVILTGDAAGFCNPLSGEGIRLAIESGRAAGAAVCEAISDDKALAPVYADHAKPLSHLVQQVYRFAKSLTDEGREEFVKAELSRISLY